MSQTASLHAADGHELAAYVARPPGQPIAGLPPPRAIPVSPRYLHPFPQNGSGNLEVKGQILATRIRKDLGSENFIPTKTARILLNPSEKWKRRPPRNTNVGTTMLPPAARIADSVAFSSPGVEDDKRPGTTKAFVEIGLSETAINSCVAASKLTYSRPQF